MAAAKASVIPLPLLVRLKPHPPTGERDGGVDFGIG
jgi:hypothetical protein